jgi:protoporphyrinogen oxidase
MDSHHRVLIIGAGPAGLAAAELAREKEDLVVVEKSSSVGGLAKTYAVREGGLEFRTDNAFHF